jgi:hypothetical protein
MAKFLKYPMAPSRWRSTQTNVIAASFVALAIFFFPFLSFKEPGADDKAV